METLASFVVIFQGQRVCIRAGGAYRRLRQDLSKANSQEFISHCNKDDEGECEAWLKLAKLLR
jgi:hypothetical protein